MGKNSEYIKQKDKNYRLKLKDIKAKLPSFTYEFLDSKAQKNPHTAMAYAYDLNIFFRYLKEFNPTLKDTEIKNIPVKLLNSLSYQDINEYQKYLSAKDLDIVGEIEMQNDVKGIARRMSSLRSLCKYLCTHGDMTNDPTAGATKQSYHSDDHVIVRMTPSEVEEFLHTIESGNFGSEHQKKLNKKHKERDLAILTLLLRTGIRVSECVSLDLKDLNFKEQSMRVVRKGGKEHILYFDELTSNRLQDYIELERPYYIDSDDEKALFMSNRKKRMAVRSIQEMVAKYAAVAVPNKKITPHKMRSTYGTALYNKTGDIRLVADVLGHSDINTTAKHYAASEDAHRRQAAKIDPYE
ncbi:MAG: tyrosine-type recombinase/integrase [Eubacteriales bacterium]|nr:tyrosine-type recombinase/integrase [Eubacteriales bacterium]